MWILVQSQDQVMLIPNVWLGVPSSVHSKETRMSMCYPTSPSCSSPFNNRPSIELRGPCEAISSLNANPGRPERTRRAIIISVCHARGRRTLRYDYEEEEEDEEEYGYNEEIGELEEYTRSAWGEALIVHSAVDGNDVELVIYKGFSSSLSHVTWADPSKSVLPARAEITTIDRIRGPFDPSDIGYIERGVPWEAFRSRIRSLPG